MASKSIRISEVRRQMSRYEPLVLGFLSLHGAFALWFVIVSGPQHWLAVSLVLLLGMVGWRYPQISLSLRVTLFVLLAWVLMFTSGGVGSFFLLWYFVTVAFYPLLFDRPTNLVVTAVIALSYVLLIPFSSSPLPLFVILARAFLLLFIGWLVSTLGNNLVNYAQQRQRSAENIQRILDASPNAVIIAQMDNGRYLDVNDHFLRLTGFNHDEIIGKVSGEVPFWAYSEERSAYLDLIQQQGYLHNFEMNLRRKSGELGTVIINSEVMELNDVACLVTFAHDVTEWRKSEVQTAYQANLLSKVSDAIISTDENFAIMSWNEAAETLYGWRADEVIGCLMSEIVLTEYADLNSEMAANQLFERGYWQGEVVQMSRDGQEWHILSAVSLITDSQGRPTGAVAVNRNITEQKELLTALQRQEARYQAVVEGQTELIARHLPDTTLSFVNDAYCRFFGQTREELIGQKLEVFLPAPLLAVLEEKFAGLTTENPLEMSEHMEKRADGMMRWLQWTDMAIFDEAGKLVEIQSVGRDITSLKQAQNQLESIIRTVPEGVLLINTSGYVRMANPIAERYLDVLWEGQEDGRLQQLGNYSLTDLMTSPPSGLWHEIEADGRYFAAIARPMAYELEDSDWVLVLRDVTEERFMARRVQEQERLSAVGQLAAGIAHDFNNILAAITLYTQMVLQTVDMPRRSQERLRIVEEQAGRAADLVQQILDFSRQSMMTKRPLDMHNFLKEIVRLLRRTLPETIKIVYEHEKGLFPIYADHSRMQQVIVNLAVNARDAMPNGGQLMIRLAQLQIQASNNPPLPDMQPGLWLVVEMRDNGTGIDEQIRTRMFEPFFTTKEVGKGTGLGLSQVYGIVQQHEGFVDVQTEIGKGTTFALYFPAYLTDKVAPPLEPAVWPQGKQQTVLLVEDNEVARQALVDTLRFLNYRVIEANNGRQALSLLNDDNHSIDLILSDVVMPEMSGIDLFRTMYEQGSVIPMVLMSGHTMGQEMELLQTDGLIGWLPKPPNIEALAQLLASASNR